MGASRGIVYSSIDHMLIMCALYTRANDDYRETVYSSIRVEYFNRYKTARRSAA